MVQIVGHFGSVVAIGVHVPDVGHALFCQVIVKPLADADQAVLVAEEPQKLQLLDGRRIGNEFGRRLGIRGGGDSGYPGELVDVGQADVQGLAAPIDIRRCAVVAIGKHGIVGLDEGDDFLQHVL